MLMSPELALLSETWDIVKNYIPRKERLEVAESLLKSFDEHADMDGIDIHKNEFDSIMKAAILSHYDYLFDGDDDDDDNWDE